MWTHEVKLEKYEATTPGGDPLQLGTAESQGNEFLHIKAGEGWEGLAIKVVFRPCKVSRMVPKDGNNMVDVPWEATKEPLTAAKGKIVFRGLDEGGRVMNSLDLPYEVKGHSPTGDRDENKYTPSAVDQIIAETKADAEAADLSAKAAAAAQKAAETSAAAALQSAKDSAGSALRASHAESEAEKSRLAAAGSADAAAGSARQAADAVQQVQEAGQEATEDVGTAQTNAVQAVQKAQTAAVQAVQGQQQTSVGAVQAAGTEAVGQVTQASQQQILAVEKAGKTQIDNVAEAGSARIEAVEKALEQAGQQATDAIGTAQSDAIKAVGDAQSAAVQAVQGQQQTSVGAVQAAGTAAVDQVSQAGQQQVQAVKDEGTAQIGAVAEAGSAQVQAVQQAGSQQITDIGEAGAQQVQAVNSAGDTKLDEINTAIAHPPQPNTATGFWQVWNAESGKYEDTNALYQGGYYTPSVAEDGTLTWTGSQPGMPELPSANIRGPAGLGVPTPSADAAGQVPTVNDTGDGYLLTGPYAPLEASIRPTANGNPAVCEDSVAWSFQGLKVYGKSAQQTTTGANLIDLPEFASNAYYNALDKSQYAGIYEQLATLKPGTQYRVGCSNLAQLGKLEIGIIYDDGSTLIIRNSSQTGEAKNTAISSAIVYLGSTESGERTAYDIILNEGSTALEYEPYTGGKPSPSPEYPQAITNAGDGGSVEIEISGANLLNPELFEPGFINETTGENQTYSTRTRTKGFIPITGNKLYVASVPATGYWTICYFYDDNFSFISKQSSSNVGPDNISFDIPENAAFLRVSWFVSVDAISAVLAFASTANVPAQAFVEPQSLPLSTPSGLPGIPVTSGGNYTDSTGQQRICDVVDMEAASQTNILAKTQIQNVAWKFTAGSNGVNRFFSSNLNLSGRDFANLGTACPCLCNCFVGLKTAQFDIDNTALCRRMTDGTGNRVDIYSSAFASLDEFTAWITDSPIEIVYVSTPITTPLSDEEIAAYRALTTYPGTTVVSTAEPVAGIEARYILDGTAAWNKINAAIAQIGAANTQTFASYEDLSGAIREGVNTTE